MTELESPQGFSAETSSSATILASSYFGYPLSTTHVVAGGVSGSGLGRRGAAVHWNVVGRMVVAWVLTLPAAGAAGALTYAGVQLFGGGAAGAVVAGAVAAIILVYIFVLARRDPVTADNVIAAPDRRAAAPRVRPAQRGSRSMMFGVLDDYVQLSALWKIGLAVLLVAVVVPRPSRRRSSARPGARKAAPPPSAGPSSSASAGSSSRPRSCSACGR